MNDIKNGDRVKVTKEFEGIVKHASVYDDGYDLVDDNGDPIRSSVKVGWDGVVSIEKVEPPVVWFKPGQIVRSKGLIGNVYAITANGFIPLHDNYGGFGSIDFLNDDAVFTSDGYELVEVGP